MQVIVLASEQCKLELGQALTSEHDVVWIDEPSQFTNYPHAQGYLDLELDLIGERISILRLLQAPVIISAVEFKADPILDGFTKINGWPGFLKGPLLEGSQSDLSKREAAEEVCSVFGKKIKWVPDQPGFISARVVAMIINEAWMALEENVSTKEDIDTAMKLGTNYPYGPFEWCDIIGRKKIVKLLSTLSNIDPRYQPAALLKKEAGT